ncbi:hypothetical protein ACFQ14_00110 [Pseudahrensia aquimaris]|uniref:Uncharacterized protein n=1 Tax=Pseudahrensia aquimaris TaxID=744461 RepID=A0ABW3FAR3_9HYPH
MRKTVISVGFIALSASGSLAEEPITTPADAVFPLTGIYSLVPDTAIDPNMSEEVATAMLQANCTSPVVFADNGMGMTFITVKRKSGRIASMQRLQQCSIDGDIMSCRQARKSGGEWSVPDDATVRMWRLGKTEDNRDLLCGPGEGTAPPAGAACFSLNLCSAEIGEITVARTKGATLNQVRDDPPF